MELLIIIGSIISVMLVTKMLREIQAQIPFRKEAATAPLLRLPTRLHMAISSPRNII